MSHHQLRLFNYLYFLALMLFQLLVTPANADIYQWQWIDPAHPELGKQPSTTVCPGGAGVNAVPYADLSYKNLNQAYLIGANLSYVWVDGSILTNADLTSANLNNTSFSQATLTGAIFTNADLTNTSFFQATLTGAIFTNAIIRGGHFYDTIFRGFTQAQLQSTASYQAKDLSGIGLGGNDLSGWDFHQQNLTNASFSGTLTGAIFTDAEIRGAGFSANNSLGFTQAQLQSTASYKAKDISGIGLGGNLSGWDFHGLNLTNASFMDSTLNDAVFNNSNIRGASFRGASGFTQTQLQSTKSYQDKDLSGIILAGNNLSGWDFHEQNLTNANLSATLTGTILTNAEIRGANFNNAGTTVYTPNGFTQAQLQSTASYKDYDISGIRLEYSDLSGWDFHGQNLTNADFAGATLTNAIFNNADVRGLYFRDTTSHGFTQTQLKSTASYKAKDLSGIRLDGSTLNGWDFHEQNLTQAIFSYASLTGANFARANLTNADFSSATLTGAIFTDADIRGAHFRNTTTRGFTQAQLQSTANYKAKNLSGISLGGYSQLDFNNFNGWDFHEQDLANDDFTKTTLIGTNFNGADMRGTISVDYTSAITTNTIRPDGTIQGLDLSGGKTLLVRDYDGDPTRTLAPIPINVQNSMAMGSNGIIQIIFEEDAWDSKISFVPGISVMRGGTLNLIFADGIDLSSQVGRTFSLFDWSGVSPTGTFNIDSPYTWDLSNLYTTGDVTLLAVPEPATMALLAASFLCLFIRDFYKRKRYLPGFYC